MINYKLSDIVESAIGAISATLFFFALKSGEPGPFIEPWLGMGIAVIWLMLLYEPLKRKKGGFENFIVSIIVSALICTFFSVAFQLATWEQMNSIKEWFGSPALITTLMATPISLLFNKYNVRSLLSRQYIRR